MLKKIFGFVFLLFGIFCSLSAVGNILRLTMDIRLEKDYSTSVIISAIVFCIVASFLFFRYGIKWISKRKKEEIESIDNIGK